MKIVIVLFIAVYSSQALLTEKWNHFKKSHGRRFSNPREESFRKGIFQKKLQHIEDHNERFSKGLETYEIGVNQFTDYTEEEMLPYTHGLQLPLEKPEPLINISSRDSLGLRGLRSSPGSFDWRTRGIVLKVKDQQSCGACWAFSATGALEAHYQIHYGSSSISLSEQQLVDCVQAANGCGGGWMNDAFMYVATNGGINYDGDYAYQAKKSSCRYQSSKAHIACKGYAYLTGPDEMLLQDMVANQGPVSVAIDASGNFGSYSSGIYYNPSCSTTSFTHAVVIVGYGNDNGQDYWMVKNSWGPNWGQNGYIKMARKRNNNCGIASHASYPVF